MLRLPSPFTVAMNAALRKVLIPYMDSQCFQCDFPFFLRMKQEKAEKIEIQWGKEFGLYFYVNCFAGLERKQGEELSWFSKDILRFRLPGTESALHEFQYGNLFQYGIVQADHTAPIKHSHGILLSLFSKPVLKADKGQFLKVAQEVIKQIDEIALPAFDAIHSQDDITRLQSKFWIGGEK